MNSFTIASYRISLVGGGSDLPEYFKNYGGAQIISTTINKYARVWMTDKPELKTCSIVVDNGVAEKNTDLRNATNPLVASFYKYISQINPKFSDHPVLLNITQDISTRGSGLGVSSSTIVALLKAVFPSYAYYNLMVHAYGIERDIMKNNCGVQDHMAASYGGLRIYNIGDNGSVASIKFEDSVGRWLCDNMIVFRLQGKRTEHSNLVTMATTMEKKAKSLQDTLKMIPDMQEALMRYDICRVGEIMNECWKLKKESHSIPDGTIDDIISTGMDCGAVGAKVTGSVSSGIGCMVFLAEKIHHKKIKETINLPTLEVGYEPEGCRWIQIA